MAIDVSKLMSNLTSATDSTAKGVSKSNSPASVTNPTKSANSSATVSMVQPSLAVVRADTTSNINNTPTSVEAYKANLEKGSNVQKTTNGAAKNPFSWVEKIVTPSMFASPDHCVIAIGPPLACLASGTSDYTLLGMCESFGFNLQNNVYTYKELRSERTIVIPLKSAPGQLSLTRMMGAFSNFRGAVSGANRWMVNNQARSYKKLFGMIVIFMTAHRADTIASLYFERCAITNVGVTVPAGDFKISESVSIVFDRVLDSMVFSGTGANNG